MSVDQTTPNAARRENDVWSEGRLFKHLTALGISFDLYRHQALHTVAESQQLRGSLPGAHVKNMFLKGKKSELWLVTCLEERQVHIRDLEKKLDARKMSFGDPELLWETLGVRPGSVTPVAVLNDTAGRVKIALDTAIEAAAIVNFHPLHNEATIAVTPAALLNVLEAANHSPLSVDFDVLEALARERQAKKPG